MSALPKPPNDLSYADEVDGRWTKVREKFLAGENISFELGQIENVIAEGKERLNNGALSIQFDWEYDLSYARIIHNSNLAWMESVSKQLAGYEKFWTRFATSLNDFSTRLGHSGIQYAFFAHGGVGLASFSALNSSDLKYSAFIGVLGAIIGVLLLTIGCVLYIEVAPLAASHIENRLLPSITHKKHRGLSRVLSRKIHPKLRLAIYFIYGSIGWLIFYAIIALIFYLLAEGEMRA